LVAEQHRLFAAILGVVRPLSSQSERTCEIRPKGRHTGSVRRGWDLPRYVSRTFTFEEENIGDFTWSGIFVKQRNGVELMISGESNDTALGSNFAALAYEARRLADPTFVRDPFEGPAPYPRPDPNGNVAALREIVKQHVLLVRSIKDALRRWKAEK